LPYSFTAKAINERLKGFLISLTMEELRNAIIIVELERCRRRAIE
jgi:hypothetical protein